MHPVILQFTNRRDGQRTLVVAAHIVSLDPAIGPDKKEIGTNVGLINGHTREVKQSTFEILNHWTHASGGCP